MTSQSEPADLELQLKKLEERGKKKDRGLFAVLTQSPLTPILLTGLIGYFVTTFTNQALEREKLKSSLILKATETGDSDASAKNLLFFLSIGLIDDPTGKIADLEKNPWKAPVTGAVVPTSASALQVFFDQYGIMFGQISQTARENLVQLFNFIQSDQKMKDVRVVAYVLATIKQETGNTFAPTAEACPGTWCQERYKGEAFGGERYKGRGYIQLTGQRNYKWIGQKIGVDLYSNPDSALIPQIAYQITSLMMQDGFATGKKLGDYITADKTDYVNARRVINGLDNRAELVADYAVKFEQMLRSSLSLKPSLSGI